MPSAEEKFRALLTRIGYQPNRAAIANAFRQDAALAEILPWISENITDAHILDPELRHDYASFEGRLSHPLDPVRPVFMHECPLQDDELGGVGGRRGLPERCRFAGR